ncbi:YihY/virulence factor BrkB family protein [Asanoa iriomotensis]|uniref:YihY/virulence factor BrkB family protein n=1 Tax=Asanoa iriomotensis TaxID=234613 RepID=UPI0019436B53|nr:YihY/virulence factor BrkB family protein [Asanoa iriomotensis]
MNPLARIEAGINRGLDRARERSGAFDHFYRAADRFGFVLGGRLAAAIAYYGFFAIFAFALVGYAVFGFVLSNGGVNEAFVDFLTANLPFLDIKNVEDAVSGVQTTGRPIGIVGLIGLVFTGIGWVEAIRSSQRAVHFLKQQPGNLVVRRFVDLGVLLIVLAMVIISVGAVDGLRTLLTWAIGGGGTWLMVLTYVLTVLVNLVIAFALLCAIPRIRMSPRRLVVPMIMVAGGLTILNSVGRLYVNWVRDNAAYALVGPVGLLIYLYLYNQILIWAAAVAATDTHGTVRDLGAPPAEPMPPHGPPPVDHEEEEDPGNGNPEGHHGA